MGDDQVARQLGLVAPRAVHLHLADDGAAAGVEGPGLGGAGNSSSLGTGGPSTSPTGTLGSGSGTSMPNSTTGTGTGTMTPGNPTTNLGTGAVPGSTTGTGTGVGTGR